MTNHGTRTRYRSGCRCLPCRSAAARYAADLRARRRQGNVDRYMGTINARNRLRALKRRGIGLTAISAACGVNWRVLEAIYSGRRGRARRSTVERILSVDERCGSLVPAGPVWDRLDELRERGYLMKHLAAFIGLKHHTIRFGRDRVTAQTAYRVERMCRDLDAGRLMR